MKLYFLAIILFFLACEPKTTSSSDILLNEEFNQNQLGWVEEWSEAHHTEISEGKLILKSLDTTAARYSSNGPRDNSVMWSLPEHWQFSTSVELTDGGIDSGFGFILYASSINYEFSLTSNGQVYISEYDYNTQNEKPIVEEVFEDLNLNEYKPMVLKLKVKGTSFKFYINDKKVGAGNFSAKSWETLRLFAKAGGTGIQADYYRFKRL